MRKFTAHIAGVSLCLGLGLGLLAPARAYALLNPTVIFQPSTATGTAQGMERKIYRLTNGPRSLVSVHVSATNQLHWGYSNNSGSTWTDAVIANGPVPSATAFTFTVVADLNNNLHVLYGTGAVGDASAIGYAIGTYSAAPDPSYTWSINGGALSGVPGNGDHYLFPSAVIMNAGGKSFLHVTFTYKEGGGSSINEIIWNYKEVDAKTTDWRISPFLTPAGINMLGTAPSNFNEIGGSCSGNCKACPYTFQCMPGPIGSIIGDDSIAAKPLYVTWWRAGDNGGDGKPIYYVRRIPISATTWELGADTPFLAVNAGAPSTAGTTIGEMAFPSGAVHAAAVLAGGGEVAFVLPNSLDVSTTLYQLRVISSSATSWNGTGITVPGLDVKNVGDGYPSLTSDAGHYYAFMSDSATRSKGALVFYRYTRSSAVLCKQTFWDDVQNLGNRYPNALLDTSQEIGVCWTASQSGGAGTAVKYFSIVPSALDQSVSVSATEVCRGAVIQVRLTVTNQGSLAVTSLTPTLFMASAGGDASVWTVLNPQPGIAASIAPGTSTTFVWTVSATGLSPQVQGFGRIAFTASASGLYACDPVGGAVVNPVVTMHTTGFMASGITVSSTVSTGQTFTVGFTVSDNGRGGVTGVVPVLSARVVSGGAVGLSLVSGPVPASGAVPTDGSLTFVYTYSVTGVVGGFGSVNFSATATGTTLLCGTPTSTTTFSGVVLVQQRAALVGAVVVAQPPFPCQSQALTITQTVTNTGVATAAAVTPSVSLFLEGAGAAVLSVSPAPVTLAGGSSVTFVWTYTASAIGQLKFTATTTATDANSGSALTTGPAVSNTISVGAIGALSAYISARGTSSIGQWYRVFLTVTNTGGADVTGVLPTIAIGPGAGLSALKSGPIPPGPVSLAPGANTTFTWTYSTDGSGVVTYTASVTGTTCVGVSVLGASTVSVTQQTPSVLAASLAAGPTPRNVNQNFLVTLTVTNTGQADATGVDAAAFLITGVSAPSLVGGPNPALPATIPGGTSRTFTWTYTGAPAGTLQFSTTVAGTDGNTGLGVTSNLALSNLEVIQAPAVLVASLPTSLPTPLCQGQTITVVLTVTNTGGATADNVTGSPVLTVAGTGTANLATSPAPVSLAGGASANFTWTYDAANVGNIRLTATVTGADRNDGTALTTGPVTSNQVTINSAGVLSVLGSGPATVSAGQWFTVTMSVTNTGGAPVTPVTPDLAVGPGGVLVTFESGPTPNQLNSLAAGTATTFTWTYSAAGSGPVVFTVSASGTACSAVTRDFATVAVTVQTPVALAASAAAYQSPLCVGDPTLVTFTVTNTGEATANAVAPVASFTLGGSGSATKAAGPTPAGTVVLAGGASVTFTWTYTGSVAGAVRFTNTATGTDANTGLARTSGPATSAPIAVVAPGSLAASAAAPALVSAGQWFTVSLTVTNTGGAVVTGVTPDLATGPGGALVTAQAGPVPAGPVTLAAGAAQTFVWTYSADGAGAVVFTATGAGDTCAATPVSAADGVLVTIQSPALLEAAIAAPAGPICTGDSWLVTLTVTNTGGAAAVNVTAPDFTIGGPGVATKVAGPSPAFPVTIAGGQSAAFTWTYTGTVAGNSDYISTVTGVDGNSGFPLDTGQLGSPASLIVSPGLLVAAAAAPVTASRGQWFAFTLTVTNTGGAAVTGVTATLFVGPGAALAQAVGGPVPAGPFTLAAGASQTVTWTYSASASGPVTFTATASGSTCAATPLLVAAAAQSVLQTPAALDVSLLTGLPATLCQGQTITAVLTVTNTGEATAVNVTGVPDLFVAGTGTAALVSSPAVVAVLAGGATVNLTWVYSAGNAGSVNFTATVAGADGNTGAAIAAGPAPSNGVTVNTAGFLVAAVAGPATASVGQWLTVTLTVTDTGGADVTSILPAAYVTAGAGLVTLQSGPTPTGPLTLASGNGQTFAWTYSVDGSGPLALTLTASGTACAGAIAATSATLGIALQTPATLAASLAALTSPLCVGDAVLVTLTVTNAGEADAVNVSGEALLAQAGAGAAAFAAGPSPAFPVTLAGGAALTFTWTYTGATSGAVAFTNTVTGADGNTGLPLSTGLVVSNGIVVQTPGAPVAHVTVPAFVSTNQSFTVSLTVTNAGEADIAGLTADLAVGPGAALLTLTGGPTPAGPLTLPGGGVQTFAWTYLADTAGLAVFTATASGATCAATPVLVAAAASSTVQDAALLDASLAQLRSPVCVGDTYLVTLTVTNTAGAPADLVSAAPFVHSGSGAVAEQAGPSPALPVTLAGGEAMTFTWTFSGSVSGTAGLATTVTATDANSGAALVFGPVIAADVDVQTPGALVAAAAGPLTASVGQVFTVTLTVTNTGEAVATNVTGDLATGPGGLRATYQSGPLPAGPQTLAAGAAQTFAWTYAAAASGLVVFSATASGTTCLATPLAAFAAWSATMQTPAALAASNLSALPNPICQGQQRNIVLTVTNTGEADAVNVTGVPALFRSGTGTAVLVSSPPVIPVLAGGASANLTWVYQATSPGSVTYTGTVTGTEGNTGAALTSGPKNSNLVTVNSSGIIDPSLAMPSPVSVGQWFTIALTVTNAGGAPITGLTPELSVLGGAGAVTLVSGPVPPTIASLAAAATATFVWTYSAAGAGAVAFSASATGTTCGGPLTAGTVGGLVVESPAALAAAASAFPSPRNVGQPFLVTVTITNTGGATTNVVNAAAFAQTGPGAATFVAGPSPALPVTLLAGEALTFTWTYQGATPGNVSLTTTVTGVDANSGRALATGAITTGAVLIQTPAALVASPLTGIPNPLCENQTLTVALTVTNTGQAGALAVNSVIPNLLAVGSGGVSLLSSPADIPVLAGGASANLAWTYFVTSAGTVSFSTTVGGDDANTGGALATGFAVSSPVSITTAGALIAAAAAPGVVSAGQWFAVSLTVTNVGGAPVPGLTATVFLGAGLVTVQSGPVPAGPVTLTVGSAQTFVWTFSANGAVGSELFSASATGTTCGGTALETAASVATTITNGAFLVSSYAVYPSPVSIGQAVTVTFTVTNLGGADAVGVNPVFDNRSTAGVALLSGPAPAGPLTVAIGASQTFVWTFTTSGAGSLDLTLSAAGQDANSGLPVIGAVTIAAANFVQTPPAVTGTLVPSTGSPIAGVPFTLTLTLSNSGGATAAGLPTPLLNLFGTDVSISSTPGTFPASIAGGATATFVWTVVAGSSGGLTFSLTVAGQDLNAGAPFLRFIPGAAALTVADAALTVVSIVPSVGQLPMGSSFTVTMTVSNVGTSTAFSVGPSLAPSGSAPVTLLSGPSPASYAAVNPGQAVVFTWTYRADRDGSVSFTGFAGGTNGVNAPTVQSAVVTVTGAGSLEEAELYPQPFIPGQGSLKFRRLPGDAKVRIYTTAGELVAELRADSLGAIDWDGRNTSGSLIVPAVYFYVIQAPSGPRKVGKLEAGR